MEINVTYKKEDWLTFNSFVQKEIPKRSRNPTRQFFVNIIIWAVIGAGSITVFKQFGYDFHWPTSIFIIKRIIEILVCDQSFLLHFLQNTCSAH